MDNLFGINNESKKRREYWDDAKLMARQGILYVREGELLEMRSNITDLLQIVTSHVCLGTTGRLVGWLSSSADR